MAAPADVRSRPPRPPTTARAPIAPRRRPVQENAATPEDPERDALLLAATVTLLVAACIPYVRVYVGLDFLRPLLASALLSVGLAWACRRAGAGPVSALVVSVAGWAILSSVAFLPDTLALGVLPTLASVDAGVQLWLRGLELIRIRPSPAFAEAGMLFVTCTGVWWVAHAVEGLVFRLQAPLRAIAMAMVLWSVPLAIAQPGGRIWVWAVPLLVGAAWLLLVAGSADLARWGRWVGPDGAARGGAARGRQVMVGTGWPVAITAITLGALLGGLLPGFDDPPWYQLRGAGGTTITTNPIVSIRPNLVNQSDTEVARVTSEQPVYLRLTALDLYEGEEWTSTGIRGGDAAGALPLETDMAFARQLDVSIEARGLSSAVILPAPYHPIRVTGDLGDRLQFDRTSATFTVDSDEQVATGERYEVTAAIPAPPPERLEQSRIDQVDPALSALPENVPEAVTDLARGIVEAAGASTPFDQALAIQDELRGWEYSLEPPQGHSATAMESFIEQRIGYCEQYAGTMAVMLRSLGIPARVAVGFTPGQPVPGEAGTYRVTNANAHAWVEVLFPGLGWLTFEPTPRTDGNVLVPTAANLAPTSTQREASAVPDAGGLTPDEEQRLLLEQMGEGGELPAPNAQSGEEIGAEEGGAGPLVPALLLGLVALGGVAALLASRRGETHLVPADQVLAAVERVQRAGRGLGRLRRPHETDVEYLDRLTGGAAAGARLATAAGRARYAPLVPAAVVVDAEHAAREVIAALGEGVPRHRRLVGRIRGLSAAARMRLGGRLRSGRRESESAGPSPVERITRLTRRRTLR
ncbi:hypothetical protein BH20ACT8_BH20ACT8_14540 [soil metagenome]